MKLKDSTFAIIAEKKNSISHKWFNENSGEGFDWDEIGGYYYYLKGKGECYCNKNNNYSCHIYTESEFEALLKAEQESEICKTSKLQPKEDWHINENYSPKPPLGLMPRNVWLDMRYDEIIKAIGRYIEADRTIPIEWFEEIIKIRNEN